MTERIMFLGGSWHMQVKKLEKPLPTAVYVVAELQPDDDGDEPVETYELVTLSADTYMHWRAYILRGYTPTRLEAMAARI